MAKNKGLQLPQAPTYYQNSNVNPNIDFASGVGKQLLNSDYTGGLSGLSDLVSYNPLSTQLALQSAQGFLTPQYNEIRNQAVQDATNSNSLNSSTFTDALAKNSFNLQSQYQGIASQAALTDKYQADQNKIGLFEYGGDLLNQTSQTGLNQSGQQNQFNLENYQNQVAATLAGQKQKGGGFLGGLTGGVGGAILGGLLAVPTGGLSIGVGALLGGLGGGLAGGFGQPGTGGQILNAGASAAGGFQSNRPPSIARATNTSYLPGMFANNYRNQINPSSLLNFGNGIG